jgi:hypothetical protein
MSGEEAGAVLEKLAKALNTEVRWIWGQFGGTLYRSCEVVLEEGWGRGGGRGGVMDVDLERIEGLMPN